jgi:uncharacterized membrane protein YfcA
LSEASSAPPAVSAPAPWPIWALLPAGAAIGFLGSMAGIGGGLFAVPVLHFLRGLPLQRAVGTALGLVLTTALVSTGTELLHSQTALRYDLLGCVLLGTLVGTQVGFRIAQATPERTLRWAFVAVLSIAAARVLFNLIWPASNGAVGLDPDAPLGFLRLALGVLVGLLGGGIAPLFGIGGGLVVTPCVFLIAPELGFVTARATALANAVVASSRSVRLHARAGRVQVQEIYWLAPGAALGAFLGTNLVHSAWVVPYAKGVLAATLLFTSARFLRDLLRNRGT